MQHTAKSCDEKKSALTTVHSSYRYVFLVHIIDHFIKAQSCFFESYSLKDVESFYCFDSTLQDLRSHSARVLENSEISACFFPTYSVPCDHAFSALKKHFSRMRLKWQVEFLNPPMTHLALLYSIPTRHFWPIQSSLCPWDPILASRIWG